jgi:alanine racemase
VFSIEGGRAAVSPLLDAGATAVVAASDLMALGTILGARERGCTVPADWSVVGYDDSALMAYTDPPLTTVRQPILAMCDHASQLLLQQLDGPARLDHEYLFRPELIVRGSTAPVRRSARARGTRRRRSSE